MSKCIYQITGKPVYKPVNFKIDECKYNNYKLSGEVLLQHYKYDKIVILRPESIKEDNQCLINTLIVKNENKNKVEVLDIHAIGRYEDKEYISNITNISLRIFIHMLENAEKIICDISTGHNIYTYALMEAARFFTTFRKLINNNQELITQFAVSEPLSKSNQQHPCNIFIEELKTHVFFSFPLTKNDIENLKLTSYLDTNDENIKREIGQRYEELCRDLKCVIKDALKAYNAIRYNTPLVFQKLLKLEDENNICGLITELNKFCKDILETNSENCRRLMLKRDIYNLYLALAIYYSIIKNVNTIKIESLDDLIKFKDIYNRLGFDINNRFLEREINEIKSYKDYISDKEKSLDEIFKNKGFQNQDNQKIDNRDNKGSDNKRNFFAHAGLERTLVKVKRVNDKIMIEYDDNKKEEICKWLRDPS